MSKAKLVTLWLYPVIAWTLVTDNNGLSLLAEHRFSGILITKVFHLLKHRIFRRHKPDPTGMFFTITVMGCLINVVLALYVDAVPDVLESACYSLALAPLKSAL